MPTTAGLHHVTAIAGPAQENLDFYAGVLGMRLVKKSVNQDEPGTYHLFFADAEGHPGTDLTFFPWSQHAPGRLGHGLAVEVTLEVPPGSLEFWAERATRYGARSAAIEQRFGARALPLTDPHGMHLALVEGAAQPTRAFTPWEESPVEAKRQIRGLEGSRLWERDPAATASFLTAVMGFRQAGSEDGWTRYIVEQGGAGQHLDLRAAPDAPRGTWGVGTIHHLAWRVPDDAAQLALRGAVEDAGRRPTEVIDRFWFRSVYFLEPGGVLFELATDGPGFGVDESPEHLGETLVLPPWLEGDRSAIEAVLPALGPPRLVPTP